MPRRRRLPFPAPAEQPVERLVNEQVKAGSRLGMAIAHGGVGNRARHPKGGAGTGHPGGCRRNLTPASTRPNQCLGQGERVGTGGSCLHQQQSGQYQHAEWSLR